MPHPAESDRSVTDDCVDRPGMLGDRCACRGGVRVGAADVVQAAMSVAPAQPAEVFCVASSASVGLAASGCRRTTESRWFSCHGHATIQHDTVVICWRSTIPSTTCSTGLPSSNGSAAPAAAGFTANGSTTGRASRCGPGTDPTAAASRSGCGRRSGRGLGLTGPVRSIAASFGGRSRPARSRRGVGACGSSRCVRPRVVALAEGAVQEDVVGVVLTPCLEQARRPLGRHARPRPCRRGRCLRIFRIRRRSGRGCRACAGRQERRGHADAAGACTNGHLG